MQGESGPKSVTLYMSCHLTLSLISRPRVSIGRARQAMAAKMAAIEYTPVAMAIEFFSNTCEIISYV